jgi:hypothetical protein
MRSRFGFRAAPWADFSPFHENDLSDLTFRFRSARYPSAFRDDLFDNSPGTSARRRMTARR